MYVSREVFLSKQLKPEKVVLFVDNGSVLYIDTSFNNTFYSIYYILNVYKGWKIYNIPRRR